MIGLTSTFEDSIETGERLLVYRDLENATAYLHDAVRMADTNSDVARAKRSLGTAYRMLGYFGPARTELQSAVQLSMEASDFTSVGIGQRMLAEVALDESKFHDPSNETPDTRDKLLHQSKKLLGSSYHHIANTHRLGKGAAASSVANDTSMTSSVLGAVTFELGQHELGLRRLRDGVAKFNKQGNPHDLVVNILRLMRYSPIDRLPMAGLIFRIIAEDGELSVYRKYAIHALFGRKVAL